MFHKLNFKIKEKWYILLILPLVLIIGLEVATESKIYSGMDEASHFDYVNYLIEERKLPIVEQPLDFEELNIDGANPNTIPHHNQHEAAQPPIYYLLRSITGGFSTDIYTRLIVLRIQGVVLILLSILFLTKTYRLLCKREILIKNDYLFYSILTLFVLSPSFLKIMIPVNNEHLLVLLMSILTYMVVYLSSTKKVNAKQSILLGVLVGAIMLTKLTSVYVVIIIMILYISKKWIWQLLILGITALLIVSPWVDFNVDNYQSITGMDKHIEIVYPIVNSTNYDYGLEDLMQSIPVMFSYTWFRGGQELVETMISSFLSFWLFLSLIYSLFQRKSSLLRSLALFIVANLIILMILTLNSNISVMIGRYMFMNLAAFTLIFYYFTTSIIYKRYFKYVATILLICNVILSISFLKNI